MGMLGRKVVTSEIGDLFDQNHRAIRMQVSENWPVVTSEIEDLYDENHKAIRMQVSENWPGNLIKRISHLVSAPSEARSVKACDKKRSSRNATGGFGRQSFCQEKPIERQIRS